MGFHSTMTLNCRLGDNHTVIEKDGVKFGILNMATQNSFRDEINQWHGLGTTWHRIYVFDLRLLERLLKMKKDTWLRLHGHISYQPFYVDTDEGRSRKMEAILIASRVEAASIR